MSASYRVHTPPPGRAHGVVLSVPHAGTAIGSWTDGRWSPDAPGVDDWAARLRLTVAQRRLLEDRATDALIVPAVEQGAVAIVANVARAVIDLNRDERDLDPGMVAGGMIRGGAPSPRARTGLGLVPRRLAGPGSVWREPLEPADVAARIATIHRPYHAALADRLAAARAAHGRAILIDLHSMPPPMPDPVDLVIGDRHGTTCSPALTDRIAAAAMAHGLSVARNRPYAGGAIVTRHAAPAQGVEAVQIELSRALYLDTDGVPDPTNLARCADLVAVLAKAAAP